MSIRVINGKGKLYDAEGKQIMAIVNYQVCEQAEDTFEGWWGELTLDHSIPLGEYLIELGDERRGTIIISNIHLQSGQIIHNYSFQGSGRLEKKES